MIRVTAATKRLTVRVKSTRLSTQMRAPVTAMRPKRTVVTPPSTPCGIELMMAPNFGDRPKMMAMTPAMRKTRVEKTRVTTYADVFGVGRDTGAAAQPRDDRGYAVADERAPEV